MNTINNLSFLIVANENYIFDANKIRNERLS